MTSTPDLLNRLSDPSTSWDNRKGFADSFARQFGWQPGNLLDAPSALPATTLIMEDGIEHAAALSFFPASIQTGQVTEDRQRDTLALSFNSLIDWHLFIDTDSVHYYYNRQSSPASINIATFGPHDYSPLHRSAFDAETKNTPSPAFPALDDLLLDTISTWRDILALELGSSTTTPAISSLMNALILTRAVEDHYERADTSPSAPTLRETVTSSTTPLSRAINQSLLGRLGQEQPELIDQSALRTFDTLPVTTRSKLVDAFYGHSAIPYEYDFSIISEHALSKIYERYVALLQNEDSVQLSMFPRSDRLTINKLLGSIYTPPYIATFFARYLSLQSGPHRFLTSTVSDPACGSGVFLRAVMEEKLRTNASMGSPLEPSDILSSLKGFDVDSNAAAAARLSLALLYLTATGKLPGAVQVEARDSLDIERPFAGDYASIMANPPFLRTENQKTALREAILHHVGFAVKGKADSYLAFLALSIAALRPGGFGFFVIPHPLLTSDNLRKMRTWIRDQAWIRLLVDLSAVRVFDAQVYVALLIVQKKSGTLPAPPPLDLVRCEADVPDALKDVLDGTRRRTPSYVVHRQTQDALDAPTWTVRGPEESELMRALESLQILDDFAIVRQGVISGANPAFVINSADLPNGEQRVYRPLLRDRTVQRFTVPTSPDQYVFYPYFDGRVPGQEELATDFPETWRRLSEHRELLVSRSAHTGQNDWWLPTRMRRPEEVLNPKIVAPRVFLLPRFAVDLLGSWVPSHAPFIRTRHADSDEDLMLYMAAILNSSVSAWFIDQNARKFARGFNELSVSLLKRIPVPNPIDLPGEHMRVIVESVKAIILDSSVDTLSAELELDDLLLDVVYRLSDEHVDLVRPRK